MRNCYPRCFIAVAAIFLLVAAPPAHAERFVTVKANATPEYLQHRAVPESYVFMQGQYYEGVTVDHSIERMDFRQIAENLASELARAGYFPTKELKSADLLLVVHWGTTKPHYTADTQTTYPMTGGTPGANKDTIGVMETILGGGETDLLGLATAGAESPQAPTITTWDETVRLSDVTDRAQTESSNAVLLGYTKDLVRLSKTGLQTTDEATLQANLAEERYFVIVKAFDLHQKIRPGQKRRVLWSIYMNIRSPGNNFPTALSLMSVAASGYFGRDTVGVQTLESRPRTGSVTLAPLIIKGEVK